MIRLSVCTIRTLEKLNLINNSRLEGAPKRQHKILKRPPFQITNANGDNTTKIMVNFLGVLAIINHLKDSLKIWDWIKPPKV